MDKDFYHFIYQSGNGKITARTISNISDSEIFMQGYCHVMNGLRTFRKDRILEVLDSESDKQSRLIYHMQSNASPKPGGGFYTFDVCFTGFKAKDKNRLVQLASEKDIAVRTSVTKGLNFLVCGYNAGPTKIEKARQQNVIALSEDEFLQLVDTGELPECEN